MKRFLAIAAIAMFSFNWAAAQSRFNLRGTIIEKDTKEAIPSATVQLLSLPDSTFIKGYATTDKGVFELNDIPKKKYVLKVSYIGYITKYMDVDLNTKKERRVDLGYITLASDAIMLEGAEVTASAAKVVASGDSLVYSTAAYRVPEGSTLEALVKQLPGAKVDSEGNITIDGKTVSKILIDGKEFFLDDKSVAMKNIPTEMIEKIKTYDRKSDMARVTGIDDGEEETVLDLTVKKGMNNGWYGNVNLGAGTEDRYSERLNVNRFKDDFNLSVYANANNVNDMGFGGGGGRGWGGWGGLRNSKDVGANFATDKEKLETGGSLRYRYDGSDNRNISSSQNFAAERGAFSESNSQSRSGNSNVRANMRIEWKPDTLTNLIFRPNFTYSRNRGSSNSLSGSYDLDPNELTNNALSYNDLIAKHSQEGAEKSTDDILNQLLDMVVNTNTSRSQTYSTTSNFNGSLQLNRRLNNEGRNITLRINGGFSDGKSEQMSAANITYNTLGRNQQNNRYYKTPSNSHNISGEITYSEPIAKKTYLQLSYRYYYSYSKNDRQAFVYDSQAYQDLSQALINYRYNIKGILKFMADAEYMMRDTVELSQFSEYRNYNQTISLQFRRVRDNYNLNIGLQALPQRTTLNYKYMGHEYPEVTRNVFNFAPQIFLRWNFSEQTRLEGRYNGRTSQPSMTNLLDIKDDSDPLNKTQGNPGLKPSFSHNINFNFNTTNPELQQGFYTWEYFSATRNSISNKTTYDKETGVRTTKPMNINGNWYVGGGSGFYTGLGAEKLFNVSIDLGASYQHNVGFYNNAFGEDDNSDIKSITKNTELESGLEFSYRDKLFYAALNGNLTYNHMKNNINSNGNQDTYDFSYGAELEWTLPWDMQINSDISMNSRRGYAQKEANTNELIWNAQLSQSFLKGNALTIMLEISDILGQQTNISRNISALMRSDSRTNAIYQYAMLRLQYRFSIYGGKNSMGTENERSSQRNDWRGGRGGW